LPSDIQELVDKYYDLLKQDPRYPSLHLKLKKQVGSGQYGSGCTIEQSQWLRGINLLGFGLVRMQSTISYWVVNSARVMQFSG
jgi:hypothetical protein